MFDFVSGLSGEGREMKSKEEAIEEAAERLTENAYQDDVWEEGRLKRQGYYQGIFDGAKWQTERSYSEEDMIAFMQFIVSNPDLANTSSVSETTARYYLEQFKKK